MVLFLKFFLFSLHSWRPYPEFLSCRLNCSVTLICSCMFFNYEKQDTCWLKWGMGEKISKYRFGPRNCPGENFFHVLIKVCTNYFSVDCDDSWGSWSPFSATCGAGIQTKTRAPLFGGKECKENNEEEPCSEELEECQTSNLAISNNSPWKELFATNSFQIS